MLHNKWGEVGEILVKTLLSLLSLFFVAILIFFIWLIRPIDDFDSALLIPKESNVSIFLRLNLKDQGIKAVLTKVEERYVKKSVEAWIISFLLPSRVSGGIIYNADNPRKPDYTVIADMGWRVRLLNLVRIASFYPGVEKFAADYSTYNGYRLMTAEAKKNPIKGFTVVSGKIVGSNNMEFLKKALNTLHEQNAFFLKQPPIRPLYDAMSGYDGLILINNTNGWLTRIVRNAEDKNDYSIFPSVDTVAAIAIGMDIVDENRVEGEIVLSQHHSSESEVVIEDMRFFAGFFRRILRTYDIDMQGDVTIQDSAVRFFFKGEGFRALWEKILKGGFSHEKISFNRTGHYLLAHTFCVCG